MTTQNDDEDEQVRRDSHAEDYDEADAPSAEGEDLDAGPERRLYLHSTTGEISAHKKAPDPGVYYRLVGGDDEAHQSFQEGEYPLIVGDKDLKMPRGERWQRLEDLRRKQYEDPGYLFEMYPEFEPGNPARPSTAPPTSQAPPYRPNDIPDMPQDYGQGASLGGTQRRQSLADFMPGATPAQPAMPAAAEPAPPRQLQPLAAPLAKRLAALIEAKGKGAGPV